MKETIWTFLHLIGRVDEGRWTRPLRAHTFTQAHLTSEFIKWIVLKRGVVNWVYFMYLLTPFEFRPKKDGPDFVASLHKVKRRKTDRYLPIWPAITHSVIFRVVRLRFIHPHIFTYSSCQRGRLSSHLGGLYRPRRHSHPYNYCHRAAFIFNRWARNWDKHALENRFK